MVDRTRLDGELKKILEFCKQYGKKDSQPLSVSALDIHINNMGELRLGSQQYETLMTGLDVLKHLGKPYEVTREINDLVSRKDSRAGTKAVPGYLKMRYRIGDDRMLVDVHP